MTDPSEYLTEKKIEARQIMMTPYQATRHFRRVDRRGWDWMEIIGGVVFFVILAWISYWIFGW